MLGRTAATLLILVATQFASGCCCCHPFLCWKQRFCGGYSDGYAGGYPGGGCDSCASGYAPAPVVPIAPAPMPIYNAVPVQPAPIGTNPMAIPPIDRIPSFNQTGVPTSIRR